jgi:hypothetical protein
MRMLLKKENGGLHKRLDKPLEIFDLAKAYALLKHVGLLGYFKLI